MHPTLVMTGADQLMNTKKNRNAIIKKQRQAIGDAHTACQRVIDDLEPDGYQLPFIKRMRKVLEETNK